MSLKLLNAYAKGNTILVGNGPSLSDDIDKILIRRVGHTVYSVNYFALSEYFYSLRPDIYVMTDPIFWRSDINDDIKSDNSNLFSKFSSVDWKMLVVCPQEGYSSIVASLKSNPNLSFLWVRSNGSIFFNDYVCIRSMQANISTPIFQNVMILALWLAIICKSKVISLYGVDFSSFKDYEVDQKTNCLKSDFSHFYKNTKAQSNASHKYNNVRSKMMHERLQQATVAFHQMYLLSRLAKMKKLAVFNSSSFSLLDSFDRRRHD